MLYLEPIGSGGPTFCKGCGTPAEWRILFAIGPAISPEHVDLCAGCVDELAHLADVRARALEIRRQHERQAPRGPPVKNGR